MRGRDTLKDALKNAVKRGCTDQQILSFTAPALHGEAIKKLAVIRRAG